MGIKIREVSFKNFGNCLELSNGRMDVVVTTEHGPRVIRVGFIGQENEFCDDSLVSNKTYNDEEWKMRGGHRLWHSPEYFPRTYIADNDPIEWKLIENGNGVILTQKSEPWVQIQKSMEITLTTEGNKVKIKHQVTNKNAWPIELSAWAISVMAPGGKEIVPQSTRDTGLLGNRVIALWPYSKMNDHRVYWGEKYITVTQDSSAKQAFKFGISNEDGWAAYFNHGNVFIKRYAHIMGVKYPDFGVSYETYTNDFMVELESLSPLTRLEPEATLSHEEEWELIQGVPMPDNDEASIDDIIKKHF
ncbi:MAG: hypothetical protein K0R78_875 [Pelosinus sp.]|nr:hypothetical protein [Pelosinus sp.]